MTNTGYVLLNGKGIDLDTESATVTGFYKKAVAAVETGKFVLLTDVVDGNLVMTNIPVVAVAGESSVALKFNDNLIMVTNTDEVTVQ